MEAVPKAANFPQDVEQVRIMHAFCASHSDGSSVFEAEACKLRAEDPSKAWSIQNLPRVFMASCEERTNNHALPKKKNFLTGSICLVGGT